MKKIPATDIVVGSDYVVNWWESKVPVRNQRSIIIIKRFFDSLQLDISSDYPSAL